MPSEKRLRALCEAVLAHPAQAESLDHWAASVGASTRTIARLFRQELGVSFTQWQQQALLARAIPLLNQGRPMSHAAQELGYQSQSAFSAMFRRAFGKSPRAFMLGDASTAPADPDDPAAASEAAVSADAAESKLAKPAAAADARLAAAPRKLS